MTKQAALPSFEDHDVANAQIRIVKCGDGLSAALEVEPKALQLGDRVSYVLSGVVSQINHREKDGVVTRLHTVDTEAITEVDESVATQMLTAAAEELARKRDQIDGQLRLSDEASAAQAEADDNGPANEVAAKAAERVKNGVASPFQKPAQS